MKSTKLHSVFHFLWLSVLLLILLSNKTAKCNHKILIRSKKKVNYLYIKDIYSKTEMKIPASDNTGTIFFAELDKLEGKQLYSKKAVAVCLYRLDDKVVSKWFTLQKSKPVLLSNCFADSKPKIITLNEFIISNYHANPVINDADNLRNTKTENQIFDTTHYCFYDKTEISFRWEKQYKVNDIQIIDTDNYKKIFQTHYYDTNTLNYHSVKQLLKSDFLQKTNYLLLIKYNEAGSLITQQAKAEFRISPLFFTSENPLFFTCPKTAEIIWRTKEKVAKIVLADSNKNFLWKTTDYQKNSLSLADLPPDIEWQNNVEYKLNVYLSGEKDAYSIPFTFILPIELSKKICY